MLFFVPENLRDTEDAKPDWKFRIKIFFVWLVGFAFALVAASIAVPVGGFDPPLTASQANFLVALSVFECFYFGLGVAFAFFALPLLHHLRGRMRRPIIAVYVCISWFFLEWFPHIRLHAFFSQLWQITIIEIIFHWSIGFSCMFMARYVWNLLEKASRRRPWKLTGNRFLDFFRSDRVQAIIIIIIFGVMIFIIGLPILPFFPVPGTPTTAELVFLTMVQIVEAALFGSSIAFLIKIIPILHGIKDRVVKLKAAPLCAGIIWLSGSWFFHGRLHESLPNANGDMTFGNWVGLEVGFHWTVMIFSLLMAYNMYGLIRMAADYSKSPFRDTDSSASHTSRSSAHETSSLVENAPTAVSSESKASKAEKGESKREAVEEEDEEDEEVETKV